MDARTDVHEPVGRPTDEPTDGLDTPEGDRTRVIARVDVVVHTDDLHAIFFSRQGPGVRDIADRGRSSSVTP
jgi:hypothetical protein